jgi:HlyD family secretion protein
MQVWASVNEADIGRIHVGLPVTFTCDAFPKDAFQGNVYQIRLNATMTQNVVTYTVVVVTDNSDGKLLPYLTANLQFQIDKRPDVLLVPNAALRWKPSGEQQVVPDARAALRLASAGGGKDRSKAKSDDKDKAKTKAKGGDKDKAQASAKSSGEPKTAKPAKDREERGRVWVKEGDYVRPIDVRLGNTDGSNTEANGDDLKEGMEAVIGEVTAADLNSDTTNPFAPKMFGKNGATKPRQ